MNISVRLSFWFCVFLLCLKYCWDYTVSPKARWNYRLKGLLRYFALTCLFWLWEPKVFFPSYRQILLLLADMLRFLPTPPTFCLSSIELPAACLPLMTETPLVAGTEVASQNRKSRKSYFVIQDKKLRGSHIAPSSCSGGFLLLLPNGSC